ncbi:MAG: metallophosphoesterase [Microbacteriaceae bacterium]
MSRRTVSTAGVLASAGLAALAWGTLIERNSFTLRQQTLPVLAAGSRPLTVLHLADIHMAPWQRQKQEWIRSLADYEPDLIVNTGDSIGHLHGIEALERALGVFHGVPGVYVNGSNDYFAPSPSNPLRYLLAPSSEVLKKPPVRIDVTEMEGFFDSLGWLNLNNTAGAMELKGSRLEFMGVNDAHLGWDKLEKLPGALDELREDADWRGDPHGAEVVSIGVTHAPYRRVLNSFVTNGADLIFAGHTHGGQVCVPGFGALVTNCDLPRSLASGLGVWHHALGAAHLNVSAGIGTSIYAPVRFACPPEAVLLTLTGDDFGYP